MSLKYGQVWGINHLSAEVFDLWNTSSEVFDHTFGKEIVPKSIIMWITLKH